MGLFERLQKKAQKLGITNQIVDKLPILSLAAVIGGILWLAFLPLDGQYRRTYISENALMPAQAETYFRESEWNIVRGYREEVHLLEHVSDDQRSAKLLEMLEQIGLETSKHEWSALSGTDVRNGTNVYGILHAPRGDSTEAMVLAAPWINQDGEYNDGGIALLAAMARYFKRWNIWSKNIIFVATSDSHLALRSWVSAYHTSLKNTGGSIEGAIVMDYPGKQDYIDEIEVFYGGLNGQLPNLDLFNTAVECCAREGLKVILNGKNMGYTRYSERLETLIKGIFQQTISGIFPGPGSENFSGWRIDAITLRARGSSGPYDITTFGRVSESIFRSINNLLEHFHQSFFFYLLLSPKHFVSIGTYLPAAMAVAHSFPLMAIYHVLKNFTPKGWERLSSGLLITGAVLLVSIVYGYVMLIVPSSLAPVAMSTSGAFFSVTIPILMSKVAFAPDTLRLVQIVSLITHGLILTTLATVNFALSISMGVFTVPLAWITFDQPIRRSLILLALSSPWTALIAISLLTGQSWTSVVNGLLGSGTAMGVWTWPVIATAWLPAWIAGLIVANGQSQTQAPKKKSD